MPGPPIRGRRPKVRVYAVPLPGYRIEGPPDYTLGENVDRVIRDHFDVHRIIVRAISSADHPPLTLDQLAHRIRAKGTDRYDPERRGVAHEQFAPYHADLQGGPFGREPGAASFFAGVMRHFYEDAPIDRGRPLRVDLLLIYDRDALVPADTPDPGSPRVRPGLETFLFRFKDPDRKPEALIGLIKIP